MVFRIALIGTGAVGRGILEAMSRKELGLILTGVADSRSGMISPEGISPSSLLERKKKTGLLKAKLKPVQHICDLKSSSQSIQCFYSFYPNIFDFLA